MPITYFSEWARDPALIGGFAGPHEARDWLQRLARVSRGIEERLGLSEAVLTAELTADKSRVRLWARRINGWFSVDQHELVVLPRYLGDRADAAAGRLFARLLAYSGSSRFEVRDWVGGEAAEATPADFFARRFLRELEPAIARGIPADYVTEERFDSSFRGQLLVRQLYPALLTTPHLLPQAISDYQHDIPANRLLRWACVSLAPQVRDHRLRGELLEASTRFYGASPELPHGIDVHPLKLPPAHSHFQAAVDLALILAHGRFLAPGGAVQETPGFVFLSWHVFQEYVGALLREAARHINPRIRIETQSRQTVGTQIGGGRPLTCFPDFVIRVDGVAAASGDSKFKRALVPGEPLDADSVAQVVTAARAVRAPRGVIFRPASVPINQVLAVGPRWRVIGIDAPAEIELYQCYPSTLSDRQQHREEVTRLAARLAEWSDAVRAAA